MSVLDFFVSKSGYMANSYLTDESTDVLVEAAGDEIALDNCVDKWLAKIRELAHRFMISSLILICVQLQYRSLLH